MRQKLINIHIPKTAGTTLRATLAECVQRAHDGKYRVLGIDPHNDGGSPFEGLKLEARRRLPEIKNPGLQVMSGHYRYRDIAEVIADHRDHVSLVTFVRDPMWRTISDYHYCISDRHPTRDHFVGMYPQFGDYLKSAYETSKQLEYLRPFEGASVSQTVENAVANIDFVGVTEHFDDDVRTLLSAAGIAYVSRDPFNVHPDRSELERTYEKYHDQMQEALEYELDLYRAILEYRDQSAWPHRTVS
ncbi:MAG: sulfotransferase family 2 domain-containing protein [Pseudomonadota bacterium]